MITRLITWILFGWVMLGSAILIYYQNVDGVLINKPVTFKVDTQNLKTDKHVYHRGDTVSVTFSVCKNREYTAHTTWRLVNETVITYPDQGTKIVAIGCVINKLFRIGEIPPYAIEGPHHIEGVSAIQINPLKTIYINFRSQEFDVN